MGIFDRFPYSSTHEMNLDFMLGKATEIAESLQEVQDGLSDIDTHKAQAEQAAQDAAQAKQAAQSAAQTASASAGQAAQHKTDAEDAADRAEAASNLADDAVEQAQTAAQNASTAADGAIASATAAENRINAAAAQARTDVQAAANSAAAGAAAAETRINTLAESLPEDFTELNNEVTNLKSAIEANDSALWETLGENFDIVQETLWNGFDEQNSINSDPIAAPFILHNIRRNAVICAIRLRVTVAGTISFGYYMSVVDSTLEYNESKVVVTNVINFDEIGIVTAKMPMPFKIPEGCSFLIQMNTDTGRFAYGPNGGNIGFYYKPAAQNNFKTSNNYIGIDIIGANAYDLTTLTDTSAVVKLLSNKYIKSGTLIDGYSDQNTTVANHRASPFMIEPIRFHDGFVESIKLNVEHEGAIRIGVINKADVTVGSALDMSKIRFHEHIILKNGVADYYLINPMRVHENDYVVFDIRNSFGTFDYGSNGEKGFYSISTSSGLVTYSDVSSLGITINGFALKNIETDQMSVYNGKRLSILGDSISTFSGYIPSGNATYYPQGTVTAVSDTWWYKLYTALGMVLDTNNSWSGSRVTTTGGDAPAGCMSRCENLGTPDVIIVWMGINDFNNEVQIGTYDGLSSIPVVTTTFREAYGIMLNKILTKYPSAEVWVCTLPQCERNADTEFPEINGNEVALAVFNKAIRELADAFGVKVLEHNKCGLTYQNMPVFNPDKLHPNKFGHSLVANNDIWQMDNVIRTRYSLS